MTNVSPRVLVIEDDPAVARFIAGVLADDSRENYRVVAAGRLDVGLERLTAGGIEAVLLDLNLPDSLGLDTLRRVRACTPDVPILAMTGTDDEELAIQAMREGAQDYLIKPLALDEVLVRALRYAITRQRLVVDLEHRTRDLSISEERLARIITRNSDGIVVVDQEGVIRFANPAAETLLGRDAAALLGAPFGFPIDAGGPEEIDLIQEGNRVLTAEMQVVQMEWEGQPAHLASLRDITNYKRLLTELDETRMQQLQMKDRFLSHVSHELRSPLTVVTEFVSILLDGIAGELNPTQQEYLNVTKRNAEALKVMIGDLLDLSRAQTGKLKVETECVSLGGVIAEAMDTIRDAARSKGIRLAADVAPDLPLVIADVGRIRQILVNLIDNAVKFTPQSGSVAIRARTVEGDAKFVSVSVTDTGCGIGSEDAGKIFGELFQVEKDLTTGSRKGLGLGLSICQELVARHGGRIWVESKPECGSVFTFTLPTFSLPSLLKPFVAANTRSTKGSIALIALQLHPRDRSSSMEIEPVALHHVRGILQRCIVPVHDILLPKVKNEREEDVLLVACFADRRGAEIVMKRIHDELARSEILGDAGLEFYVSCTLVPVPSVTRVGRTSRVVDEVVEAIHVKLRECLSEEQGSLSR